MPNNNNYLTTQEAARIFRRNRMTIYRWIAEGFLDAKKVRDGYLIKESEINRILQKAKNPA